MAMIPVQAKPPARVPVCAIIFPIFRIGIVEPPVKVIEVASEVIDKIARFFKLFIVDPLKTD